MQLLLSMPTCKGRKGWVLSLLQPCWSGGPTWEAGSESSISLTRTFPSISCPAVGRLLVQSAPSSTEPPSLQGYQALGRRAPAHTAAPKINLQPFSLLFSQGFRCVGQVMTPCLGPCIHSHRMPVPAPACSSKPQVTYPLLWEALPATSIPLNSSLPVPQCPMNPATALTLLNSCAFPLYTGHPGPHHAWRTVSIQ